MNPVTLTLADRLAKRSLHLVKRIERVNSRVTRLQRARLLSGGAFAIAIFLSAVQPSWHLPAPAVVIFAPIFATLVVMNRRWAAFLLKLTRLKAFTERQEARARGLSPVPSGAVFERETYGRDLDVFGPFSLWTLIDETLTDGGSLKLKSWITNQSFDRKDIEARQETVRSLRADAWFYTRLTLIADRALFRGSTQSVLDFLDREQAKSGFTLKFSGTVAIWIFWLAAVFGGEKLFGSAAHAAAGVSYFLFLFANFGLIGRSEEIFKTGVGASHNLELLFPIFSALEKRTEKSAALRSLAPVTTDAGPSKHAGGLGFAVGILSFTSNPILYLAINSFTPWSALGVLLLERSRKKLRATFPTSLAELANLEALFSLVIFDRYQTQTYPSLGARKIEARGLFHPLIQRGKVVANDFSYPTDKKLGLLTGSNMSGKSTFLRTIGINQLLANLGAPVFADEMKTRPLKIETCIEVSDSLRDGFSYFYAEVRRLKSLLESAQSNEVLYLIDEIFRGTNNRERQIGSRAVIRALAKSTQSEGFVSTHDLELTALEQTEPGVFNLHFRETIEDGRMSFTYRLQSGASPTTNALRIMQIEGLPVDAGALTP